MRRGLFAMVSLLMSASIHAAGFWLNPDQEGDALIKRGDAKSAASIYSDPQRKGYAQLLSGDYKAASQTLAGLHDGEAYYNLGNALAHTGDLKGALSAYDAALRQNPNDRDAKHNRELVADALKRQPPKQSGGAQKQKNSSGEGKPNNQEKNGQKHDESASDKSQKGDDQPSGQNASPSENGENMPKPSTGPLKPFDDARTSEQQIEKDQWLHSIPDDPGGLLRRKFLIEHMMRQQEQ